MEKNIIKQFLTITKSFLSRPHLLNDTNTARTIALKKEYLQLISCSNIVIHVQTDFVDGYLSECRKHLPIAEYVNRFIDDYFSCFYSNTQEADADKKLILDSLQCRDNFLKFSSIGRQSPHADSAYRRFLQTDCGDEIGLDLSAADSVQIHRIRHFVERFVWPQLTAFYANSDLPTGTYHSRTSCKVLATEAMARLIGLEQTIPHAEYTRLCVTDAENRIIFGNLMVRAKGTCAMDIPANQRKSMITPEFQQSLLNMNLLDVICHELDHSPNNYNVVTDSQGNAIGVSVYDNNGLGTFSLNGCIDYETYKKCSSILNSDGTINRPCLDKTVVERILALRFRDVSSALSPFLRIPAVLFTWRRIVALKKALRKTIHQNPHFLLDDHSFSDKTIEDELSGAYGKTYLLSFLQDCLQREQYR